MFLNLKVNLMEYVQNHNPLYIFSICIKKVLHNHRFLFIIYEIHEILWKMNNYVCLYL